jgi:S-formylglutathione hydrolase FrmB
MNPFNWSLITGPVPVISLISTLVAMAWLAVGRNAPRRGSLGSNAHGGRGEKSSGAVPRVWLATCLPLIVMTAGGIIAVLTWLLNNVWRPFPDLLPSAVVLWSWVALTGTVLACARQLLLRTWPRRVAAIGAAVVVLATAANQVNGYFQAYPSLGIVLAPWRDAKPMFTRTDDVAEVAPKPGQALERIWNPPSGMPRTGAVYTVNIPGIRSKFPARPGYIYLPPAYLAMPRPQIPVLVLLAGQPGDPRAWLDSGQIQAMMDGFAKRHHGLAPIVVMPDDLGSEFANPMCMNSRLGQVQTYLTVDVPNWINKNLQIWPSDRGWAIGGFSQGGTCAIQLSVQAPRIYRLFVDISGQAEPSLGSRTRTISKAFGGDAAAYARVDPIVVLAHTRFPHNAGVFVAGANDSVFTPQQRRLYLAARHAGMNVTLIELPGGHNWRVWRGGLERNVGWLANGLGITEGAR